MRTRRELLLGSAGVVVAAAGIAIPLEWQDRLRVGTEIGDTDVSGRSEHDARADVQTALAPYESHALSFTWQDRRWDASLADLGMVVDYDAMLDAAQDFDRVTALTSRYASFFDIATGHSVPVILHRDDATLRRYIEGIAAEIAITPEDARLAVTGGEVSVTPHVVGRAVDVDRAIAEASTLLDSATLGDVALQTTDLQPSVTTEALTGKQDELRGLVGDAVVYALDGDNYRIEAPDLAAALRLDDAGNPEFDATALQPRLDQIANAVLLPARNVKLGWNDGLYVVEPEEPGRELDREALVAGLLDVARSSSRKAAMPVVATQADAREDNVAELGIETHLAWGGSSFAGSSASRAANVVAAADNITYKMVPPGAVFSFNQIMGPITVDNGFVEGKIIQGDWTASDLGGGVCQVSTTVFRAAQEAGFRFDEWHAHGWRLAFYEADGSDPGRDAAIYQPNSEWEIEKDLRFTNTLDSWLLLMMVIEGDSVYAHFYGRDPGWTVEIHPARIGEDKPIPDPVERENPELAPGERVKVQNAVAGCTVRVQRTVTAKDGTVLADGDFVSDYRSQPEAWEVGPKP
jgi:vancomycin resistance protein YoaR